MSDCFWMMHSSRPPTSSGLPAVGVGSSRVQTPSAHLFAASSRSTPCGTPPSSNTATSPGAPGFPRARTSVPPVSSFDPPGPPGLPLCDSEVAPPAGPPPVPPSVAVAAEEPLPPPAADAAEVPAVGPVPPPAQEESRTTNTLAQSRRTDEERVMPTSSGRGPRPGQPCSETPARSRESAAGAGYTPALSETTVQRHVAPAGPASGQDHPGR